MVVGNDDISIAGFRSVGKHAIVGITALLQKLHHRNEITYLLTEEYFDRNANTITIFSEHYDINKLVNSS